MRYSSPLGRAQRTAELIVGEDLPIEPVDDLREWHLGSLEGTSNREMPPQPWGDYPVAFGGESEGELRARMVAALSRIMARPQHDRVLAVSHGSACQEFLEYVAGGEDSPTTVPCFILAIAMGRFRSLTGNERKDPYE